LAILSKKELLVQQHTIYEHFSKTIAIESDCLLDMLRSHVLPAAFEFRGKLAQFVDPKEQRQVDHLNHVSKLVSDLIAAIEQQATVQQKAKEFDSEEHAHEQATYYRNEVMNAMAESRRISDLLEKVIDDKLWPFPKYSELLFLK
jgi:glutamine synthetase